ncbi:glycoside hydrolase family 2 TIM barrel-domain containing protein [Alistipes sp.]|uniref:glycoside hydrolase family 2 TIM barrel-domain containing protein n=1 Tax=Alistipes sp. TaxID=1872444 RepID=UPI003AF08355
MKLFRTALSLALLLVAATASASRVQYTVNDAWRFAKGSPWNAHLPAADDSAWEVVDIPHTWNAADADDDTPGFYRGPAWYRKHLTLPASAAGKQVYLAFEGANQVTRAWVNGHYAGEHRGGYTRFVIDITRWVVPGGENLVALEVTNAHDPNIPPLSADYTFFGGIYRDVSLLVTDKVHVAPTDLASSGVYLTTPAVSADEATVEVRTLVANRRAEPARVRVEHRIAGPDGREAARVTQTVEVAAGEVAEQLSRPIRIARPHLWDIDSPNLYRVSTRILTEAGEVLDEVSNPLGFRWFEFDPDKGFSLNGRPRKLIGTCRHQDYLGRGWALTDAMHERDLRLLKAMGGNFLRVSHYPQDPVVLELCDRLGIVASVEIPVVNAVTETPEFLDTAVGMVREMIRQDRNHPSVVIWAYMNEVLLREPYKDEERLAAYYKAVERVARALEAACREEDPARYTMMAFHNAPDRYAAAGLTRIPMIQGWNLYQGWYERDITEFERILDRLHAEYPGQSLLVTEYGPGVDPRLHSYAPEQFDFSQEYGLVYHRHYLREMLRRPFVAGSSLWNLNDFYSEPRVDAVPHVNNKGITGLDREQKDTYLFYKTLLDPAPQLAIGNRMWRNRGGADRGDGRSVQSVPVFSNQPSVTLRVNGRKVATERTEQGVALFAVPFVAGENRLVATAGALTDALTVDFRLAKASPREFTELNVMLGSPRYYDDRTEGLAWIPEQPYAPGGWGYVGGRVLRRAGTGYLGSAADILGTDDNPLFQTQRVGIEAFRADVPDGHYSVYLYWAELDAPAEREKLAYNLGADDTGSAYRGRRFDVEVNGVRVLEDFSIASEVGFSRALVRKVEVPVEDGEGIRIDFRPREGEAVLNAIRIYRNR